MSTSEISRDEIAKRYGGVLLALAEEKKELKALMDETGRLSKAFEGEKESWNQSINPTLSLKIQKKIVEKISSSLKLGSLFTTFLLVLCDNRRLQNLPSILKSFQAQARASEGLIEGILETSFELSPKNIDSLQKNLEKKFKKNIILHQKIEENLLGGVILHIGSLMIDASLRTQLNKLQYAMKG